MSTSSWCAVIPSSVRACSLLFLLLDSPSHSTSSFNTAPLQDLRGRYEQMFEVMMPVIRQIKDIKLEAGQLNLRYER